MSKRKKPRICFTPSTVVDALQPYTNEALDIISRVLGRKSVKLAFITDESAVWCYMEKRETGEKKPHPFDPDKMCRVVTSRFPENDKLIEEMSEAFGFPVDYDTHVYELAIKLRDR